MVITVKRIVVYRDFIDNYFIENYKINTVTDYQYLCGVVKDIIPRDKVQNVNFDHIKLSMFNGAGNGKIIVNVGSNGLCYILLRPEYWVEKIIVEPDDVVADIYYGEKGLIYSFYNPTKRGTITISVRIAEDVEGVYRDISSAPNDIHLRQYYIRRALVKFDTSIIQRQIREYPENMTVEDVSEFLNVKKKTIQNWTSEGKIPHLKLGTTVRYPKSKIEEALERGEIGRVKKKK